MSSPAADVRKQARIAHRNLVTPIATSTSSSEGIISPNVSSFSSFSLKLATHEDEQEEGIASAAEHEGSDDEEEEEEEGKSITVC
jgi:hypothetical protein